jgi:sec-independent protein translocase protein TatA
MVTGFLSPVHIALVLVVVLLLFGAKRLPELGSSLGSGLRDFKDSLEGGGGGHAQITSVDAADASAGQAAPAADQSRAAPPAA